MVYKLQEVLNKKEGLGVELIFRNELGQSMIKLPFDLKLHVRYADLFLNNIVYA